MATSSILGGTLPPVEHKGVDVDSLGPSDSSDSGSDAAGTEGRAAGKAAIEEPTNADILPDRVGVLPDAAAEVAASPDDLEAANAHELELGSDDTNDEEND